MLRKEDVSRDWHVVDVEGKVLGRIATKIAQYLIGKDKPTYTPHVDNGDYVVVVNAAQVDVTRNKADKKTYYRHSRFPGALKEILFKDLMQQNPERIIYLAVKNMLPKNKFRKRRLARLKIYPGGDHPYQDKL